MKKTQKYSKHYKDTAQGHICLLNIRDNFESKAFMVHLEGASSMKQKELDHYGTLMASSPDLFSSLEDCANQLRMFLELHENDEDGYQPVLLPDPSISLLYSYERCRVADPLRDYQLTQPASFLRQLC